MIYKKTTTIERTIVLFSALLITLAYASLNFNYLTNWIDEKGDCLTYDYYVRLGIPQYLYNPHHIGFDWAGEQMYKHLREKGYTGTSMTVLQIRNLIVSSIGLGLLFFLFYHITRKYLLSLLVVLMIAFSAAFWIYSQINDTPIIHSILVSTLFLLALYYPQAKHKKTYAGFLGIWHAITIFFHQSDLIMLAITVPIILFASFFNEKKINWKESLVNLGIYSCILSCLVVVAYYFVGIVLIGLTLNPKTAQAFNNIEGSSYFFNWLILYAKIDYWGKGFEELGLFQKIIIGIKTYLYQPQNFQGTPVASDFKNFFSPPAILPNLLASLFIVVLSGSLVFFRKMFKKHTYAFLAVIIYMIVYSIFASWWEADYREFWVAPMFSFWILALLFFDMLLDGSKIFKPLIAVFSHVFLTLIALLLFYFNFVGFIYPNHGNKYQTYSITTQKIKR